VCVCVFSLTLLMMADSKKFKYGPPPIPKVNS